MGSRQQQLRQSRVRRKTLNDPELRAALQVFGHLLTTCMGPHGSIKTIQNSVGGPFTLTSCSNRLLHAMSFSRPCLRIIVTAVTGHLRNYHDGGLLAGSLCLQLVNSALSVETVSRKCVRDVYEVLLGRVFEYLNSDECPVRVHMDTSNVRVMLWYVKSLITKPLCQLRSASLDHVSQLILKVFLSSIPDTLQSFISDRIFVLQLPNKDIASSEVKSGLLIECFEISALKGEQDLHISSPQDADCPVMVLLVDVSMSGDAEEAIGIPVEARPEMINSATEFVISRMVTLCDWLADAKIGLLLCQKVIHPRVKSHLRSKGILFVDRLGIKPMAYIQDLTGAIPVSSVLVVPSANNCGQLTSVRHRLFHGRSYLHLERSGSCVSTLFLCAGLEEQLAELHAVVQSAVTGLYSILQRPRGLCGGGCWQIHLANMVRCMVEEKNPELTSQLQITKSQLLSAAAPFAESLEAAARSLLMEFSDAWVDLENWHLWSFPRGVDATQEPGPFTCSCGMLSDTDIDRNNLEQISGLARNRSMLAHYKNYVQRKGPMEIIDKAYSCRLVLDTPDCVLSAVRTAVTTACTVLSITQFVYDTN